MLVRLVVAFSCGLVAAAHADPFDKPAFTATPKEVLAAAKAAPAADHDVVILREEQHSSTDDQSRETWRFRRVFVVRTQAGVDSWGTFSVSWSPFYQDKPTLRARVISPDETVTELDQKLVSDAPETNTSPTVFSDQRRMQAPLPRLRVGAVIEEELVVTDRQAILPGVGARLFTIGEGVPVQRMRITFSTPAKRGRLHSAAVTAKPKYAVSGGRETWSYELGPLPANGDPEQLQPKDLAPYGYAGVTTTTWPAIAREYRKLLDKRIADGPFALPSGLPKTPTVETVRAITAWLHQHVRYTGIEFGESSIIPWTPAETAKRGFGDCKDKATLLIAMLRQAGVRAELALLSTGPGFDVIKELPGMVFDHAIVRARIGNKEIWIDATEDLLPPGQLPSRDQGRRALVIADDTKALVEIPRAAPADNLVKEIRTFELSESGPSRVTEVSTEGGVFDHRQRAWIRDGRPEDIKKDLTAYADREYRAKLARYSTTAPADLTKPFVITTEMIESSRAYAERGHIEVFLFPSDTLAKVPGLLMTPDKQRPRKNDFEWYAPHVYEIENRLVVPPGYTMPSIPPDRTRQLGPMKLVEKQRIDGRTLVVTFRLDTGKHRITAAEVAALQKEIEGLGETPLQIVIDHTGWSLAERGKLREAIIETEKLIALHPKEALHHTQLAFVLVNAGMGTAARRAARKAVEVEPSNADAHVVLGWVLRHDLLGREYGRDYDRAGAVAAYAKARKLDPKHVGAASEHADVLRRDSKGVAYGKGSDINAAIEAARAALALEDTDDNALALARVLAYQGAYAEVETMLRKRASSEQRDGLLVATIAALRGAKAGVEAASRMRAGNAREALIAMSAGFLLWLRQYDAARAMFAETNLGGAGTPWHKVLAKLKRADGRVVKQSDPRIVMSDVIGGIMDRAYAPRFMWDAATAKEQAHRGAYDPRLQSFRELGMVFFEDLMVALLEPTVEGTGPWRLDIDVMGTRSVIYVALDGQVAKVIGSMERHAGAARHVLRLLAKNDHANALRLLDWLAKDLSTGKFAEHWRASARDKDSMTLAAALLAGGTETSTVPVLSRCKSTVGDLREVCDETIATIYLTQENWKAAEQHTAEWLKRAPGSKNAKRMRIGALTSLGRHDDADRALADAQLPDDIDAAFLRQNIAIGRGQLDAAIRHLEAPVKQGNPFAINQAAWLALVNDKELPRALELATMAAGTDKSKASHSLLNTLAALEAELGHLQAAKTDALQAMQNGGRDIPSPSDWYVLGRIAEQLGLRDDAIAAYRRVTSEPQVPPAIAAHALAQRRLRRMGVK